MCKSPTERLEPILDTLQQILSRIDGNEAIIAGDFNAKRPIWGYQAEDRRSHDTRLLFR